MRNGHETERRKAAERRAKAAAAPSTVGISKRPGGGGQEEDWMDHLNEDMSVFRMKFEGWRKAAQKAGRWF